MQVKLALRKLELSSFAFPPELKVCRNILTTESNIIRSPLVLEVITIIPKS
jgi:hypothetical protein